MLTRTALSTASRATSVLASAVSTAAARSPSSYAATTVRSIKTNAIRGKTRPVKITPDQITSKVSPIVPPAYKGSEARPAFAVEPAHHALMTRIGFDFGGAEPVKQTALLEQVFTHESFDASRRHSNVNAHGARLATVGRATIEMYVSEWLHVRFPRLPVETLDSILSLYFRTESLGKIGKAIGLEPLVRWEVQNDALRKDNMAMLSLSKNAVGASFEALVGAIVQEKGTAVARKFIQSYVHTVPIDVNAALAQSPLMLTPTRTVKVLFARKKLGPPVARLLKETGRDSSNPVFIVGIFSGVNKMGEGFGSSMKMAEYRACKDVLVRYFGKEALDYQLPSDVDSIDGATYTPAKLADAVPIL